MKVSSNLLFRNIFIKNFNTIFSFFQKKGHVIKNDKSQLNDSVNNIKTMRRIILTGTPLQNNLDEYYVMINFVRPFLLGDAKEYNTNFVIPITDGLQKDCGKVEVQNMKERVYVLQRDLKKVLHRVGYEVLQKDLLPKHEYVIKIKLTSKQEELYRKYIAICKNSDELDTLNNIELNYFLADMHIFRCIFNHPFILKTTKNLKNVKVNDLKEMISKEEDKIGLSSKVRILLSIILICEKNSEKLVVFSQDLRLLDLIEEVLIEEEEIRCANFDSNQNQFTTFMKGKISLYCMGVLL